MAFAEIHFHTKEASHCGQVPAADGIAAYKKAGYDAVVVTDHYNCDYFFFGEQSWEEQIDAWLNGYRAAKAAGDELGVKVLLGAEFRFDGSWNDYLVYGLSEDFLFSNPRLYSVGEKEFHEIAKKNGFFFAQAHPFRRGITRCEPSYLDGMEVFNTHPEHEAKNESALAFARENSLIPLCGSDFHQYPALRGGGMLFEHLPRDNADLVQMLFAKQYRMVVPAELDISNLTDL